MTDTNIIDRHTQKVWTLEVGPALLACVITRRVVQGMAVHVLGPGEAFIASGVGAGKPLLCDMVCVHCASSGRHT